MISVLGGLLEKREGALMSMTRPFAANWRVTGVLVVALGCAECSGAGGPTGSGCPTSVSGLNWSIQVNGGTPPAFSTEMRVGQSVTMGVFTFSIGCTIPSHSVSWRHSNPAVALLTAGTPQEKAATMVGVAPGTTVITAEVVGNDGARASATTQMRVTE